MTLLAWDDSIALHIPAIDAQHKELIGCINTLDDAVAKGEGARVISDVFQKLINYVFEHFAEEERLMLSYNYPDISAHRQEHDYFVTRLKDIQGHFQDGDELSKNTLEFLVEWLVRHIRGTDQAYGRFIHAAGN